MLYTHEHIKVKINRYFYFVIIYIILFESKIFRKSSKYFFIKNYLQITYNFNI